MNQQLSLLSHDYEGTPVHFQENGYLNATEAARRFGKEPRRFLETEPAKRKIRQIAEKLLIDKNQIVIVRRGAPETGGGTWFHPKLAVTYAAWLDDEFAWWCEEQIESILRGDSQAVDRRVQYAQFFLEMHRINPPTPGFYSILKASSELMYASIDAGLPFDERSNAVISIGKRWATHYAANNLAQLYGHPVKGPQRYPLGFAQSAIGDFDAWHYPDASLGAFNRWLQVEYLPNYYPAYVKRKEKLGALSSDERRRLTRAVNERYYLSIA